MEALDPNHPPRITGVSLEEEHPSAEFSYKTIAPDNSFTANTGEIPDKGSC